MHISWLSFKSACKQVSYKSQIGNMVLQNQQNFFDDNNYQKISMINWSVLFV